MLFEISENAKVNDCAPEVVVISSNIVKNILKEANSRWTEMIIDLHEEEFSMQERSSVFEELRACQKRQMTAKMIKTAIYDHLRAPKARASRANRSKRSESGERSPEGAASRVPRGARDEPKAKSQATVQYIYIYIYIYMYTSYIYMFKS